MNKRKTFIDGGNDGFIEKFFSINVDDIVAIKAKDRDHPLKQLMSRMSENEASCMIANTDFAYKQLRRNGNHMHWLEDQRARFLEQDDFSESSGALGELRCFGELLAAGFSVEPVKVCTNISTPDFKVRNSDDEADDIWIEVHSKQMSNEEAENLENFLNDEPEPRPIGGGIMASIRYHEVVPMGRSRPGKSENTTANVIRKIAKIKCGEKQLSPNQPSILWLDFQDQTWHKILREYLVCPLVSCGEELTAGCLWYAFYGYKGAPIFEDYNMEMRSCKDIVLMEHDGRFRKKTKVDAVIVSLPAVTIALENPYSQKPIPPWFWRKAILFNRFRLQFSKLNWPCKNLKQIIDNEREIIEAWKDIP